MHGQGRGFGPHCGPPFYPRKLHPATGEGLADGAGVDGLAGSARAAGLDVVAVGGSFGIIDPELGLDLHAATLLAARERAVASGIATGQQIDDLAGDLRAAKSGGYQWVSMPFFLDLTLRKPLAA
jgi:hypothetical protein